VNDRSSQQKAQKNTNLPPEALCAHLRNMANNTVCIRKTSADAYYNPQPIFHFRHYTEWFVSEVFRQIDRDVVDYILCRSHKFRFLYMSQARIARGIGYSREEVNRSIKRLRAWGIISANYRHLKTSVYRITSLFKLPKVIVSLHGMLKNVLVGAYKYLTQLNISYDSKINNSIKIYRKSSEKLKCERDLRHAIANCKILNNFRKRKRCRIPVLRSSRSRRTMITHKTKELVKAIERLSTTLKLTHYGKSKLSVFPFRVILHVDQILTDSLKRGHYIENPFAYVYSLAQKECIRLGVLLDYDTFERIKEKYKFTGQEKTTYEDIDAHLSFKAKPIDNLKQTSRFKIYKHKKEMTYDKEYEEEGYTQVEKSDSFQQASSLFGDFFKKCKDNVLAKAA